VRFNTELVTFEQDARGVTARIRHRTTGEETTVHAAYLIAADAPTARCVRRSASPVMGRVWSSTG